MQAKHINPTCFQPVQAGFTLVELMVGMSIGLLATIIIVQVLSVFETQRSSTSGTADAQTNGGIALYTIARELQQAGYPLFPATDSALECTTVNLPAAGANAINGVGADTTATDYRRLSPVKIVAGVASTGVSASDTLTIRYGTAPMGGVPTPINAAPTGNNANVDTNLGCKANDIALISNGATCTMSKVTALVGTNQVTLASVASATSGAQLACMGAWNEVTYRVNGGNLERQNLAVSPDFIPTVVGIANLQVQYGDSATAKSNTVIGWSNASGLTFSEPSVANRNRIKAVRIAVVARNAKMEASNVTSACSSLTDPQPTGLCAWAGKAAVTGPPAVAAAPAPEIDLSQGDPDWRRYRYRVFETIIPLRNMIWAKETF